MVVKLDCIPYLRQFLSAHAEVTGNLGNKTIADMPQLELCAKRYLVCVESMEKQHSKFKNFSTVFETSTYQLPILIKICKEFQGEFSIISTFASKFSLRVDAETLS